ncbi:MAG: hypothetical protein ACRD1H_09060, partial [Vicinamibacterales bacterium]
MGLIHHLHAGDHLRFWKLVSTFGLLAFLLLAPLRAGAQESSSQQVYFDGTGQTLGGAFYDGWLIHGGLEQAGPPVSPAVQQGNRWVQWFEFTRLEASTPALDQVDGGEIQPAPIGLALAESFGLSRWHPAFQPPAGKPASEVRQFENGHTIANGFKEFYEKHAAEPRLGAAISREFG